MSSTTLSLQAHHYLHSRSDGRPWQEQEREQEQQEGEGLPPSYSLLQLDKDLPSYSQATQ